MHAHDQDVAAWAAEQSQLLRERRFDELDAEHIADELEDLARSERRLLAERLAGVIAHLLLGQYKPERRGAVWDATLRARRRETRYVLSESPSLSARLDDARWIDVIWSSAVAQAVTESGLDSFPDTCPWSIKDQVLDDAWLPT